MDGQLPLKSGTCRAQLNSVASMQEAVTFSRLVGGFFFPSTETVEMVLQIGRASCGFWPS